MKSFTRLTTSDPADLVFGSCPAPVAVTPEITVGGGEVLPEVNYMLPHGFEVAETALDKTIALYRTMAQGVLQRAEDLGVPRLVIEIELVFELTLNPTWGERVIQVTREVIEDYKAKGVHAALRTTVADIRDRVRPPRNRTSKETGLVLETFDRCAPYSDILAIESTGGKEVSDGAILSCDIGGVIFALGVLGSQDMAFLWPRIVDIAHAHGKVAGGDAACGFANTAMQLARKRMISSTFAAVVRAVGAARSLCAMEAGAVGPDKDCAYEGPILKAITGIPIAMEGKSAACAHSSHIGNVAMACADLWSNESVPYAQLFGGYTPETSLEELWYDCKLLNTAREKGEAEAVAGLLTESDVTTSAEALVLSPMAAIRIGQAIVDAQENYATRAYRAAREAVALLREATESGRLRLGPMEAPWLDIIEGGLDEFGGLDGKVLDHYVKQYEKEFVPAEYGVE